MTSGGTLMNNYTYTVVDEIVCAKYRFMPDAMLLYYLAKQLSEAEREVIEKELSRRHLLSTKEA